MLLSFEGANGVCYVLKLNKSISVLYWLDNPPNCTVLLKVFGVTMIGFGVKVLVDTKGYKDISGVDYLASAQLMIGVGVIVTIIAFLGCCGACLLNKCLLMTVSIKGEGVLR